VGTVAFADMAGKGVPGLVGVANGSFGWFDPGTSSPWTWHVIAVSRRPLGARHRRRKDRRQQHGLHQPRWLVVAARRGTDVRNVTMHAQAFKAGNAAKPDVRI